MDFILFSVLIPVYLNILVTSCLKLPISFLPLHSYLLASHFQSNVLHTPKTHHAHTTNILTIYASGYTFSILVIHDISYLGPQPGRIGIPHFCLVSASHPNNPHGLVISSHLSYH